MKLKIKLSILLWLLAVPTCYGQDCNLTVTSISFGSYNPIISSNLEAVGYIDIICPSDTVFTIRLSSGQNAGGSYYPRSMSSPSSSKILNYNLYIDANHTTVWGDGTGSTEYVLGNGTGGLQRYTVYGQIPARQNVGPGNYSDILTVTVSY